MSPLHKLRAGRSVDRLEYHSRPTPHSQSGIAQCLIRAEDAGIGLCFTRAHASRYSTAGRRNSESDHR